MPSPLRLLPSMRQLPSFTGSVTSMVNDNQADSIPEVLSIDILEDSAMDSTNVVSGHKNLAILDMNSFIITSRWTWNSSRPGGLATMDNRPHPAPAPLLTILAAGNQRRPELNQR